MLRKLAPGKTVIIGAAILLAGVLVYGVNSTSTQPPRSPKPKQDFDVALDDSRKVAGFVESYGRQIEEARRILAEKDKEITELRSRQEESKSMFAEMNKELTRLRDRYEGDRKMRDGEGTRLDERSEERPQPRIQKITLDAGRDRGKGKQAPSLHIPAGSLAEATLVTGVYAPVEGGALPVQMRLDAAWIGPNRSRVPISEGFLIGKAEGEANSRRVLIQLAKLSYVGADGKTIEVPINGYATDDDGVLGISGTYVWRVQETMALAGGAGFISGAAEALSRRETTSTLNPLGGATEIVTGDVVKFAGFRGASRASEEFEKLVVDRLRQVVPAIYVPNARKITVLLLDGVTLEGLRLSEVKNDVTRNPYHGLDFDR